MRREYDTSARYYARRRGAGWTRARPASEHRCRVIGRDGGKREGSRRQSSSSNDGGGGGGWRRRDDDVVMSDVVGTSWIASASHDAALQTIGIDVGRLFVWGCLLV